MTGGVISPLLRAGDGQSRHILSSLEDMSVISQWDIRIGSIGLVNTSDVAPPRMNSRIRE